MEPTKTSETKPGRKYTTAHGSRTSHTHENCRHYKNIVNNTPAPTVTDKKPKGCSWCDECQRQHKLDTKKKK